MSEDRAVVFVVDDDASLGRSGPQYLLIDYDERLGERGIRPSVGSTGDSYGNASPSRSMGCTKPRSFYRRGPWRSAALAA